MKRNQRGFTLIELLIVVAIIGIIVAISIANFLLAIEKARQRRTMSDMRSISTAIEIYQSDWNAYPPSAAFALPTGLSLPTVAIGTKLTPVISPTYLTRVPLVDGWNSWFVYSTDISNTDYCLGSNGQGGAPEAAPAFGPTTAFTADILMVDSTFVQYPSGTAF
ncbi:MAG: prepilin-type N-terminal cleavage/methylation domain-containing protein [Thermoanaerobaculia bacterium]